MSIINIKTGEVLDRIEEMNDDDILMNLKDLEEVASQTTTAARALKALLLERMTKDGAKLKLTSFGKVRIQMESKVRDKRIVESLYSICPDDMRDKCFQVEYKPMKRGLTELSKLGAVWSERVDQIYEQTPTLKIEWSEVPDKAWSEPVAVTGQEVTLPF